MLTLLHKAINWSTPLGYVDVSRTLQSKICNRHHFVAFCSTKSVKIYRGVSSCDHLPLV